VLFPNITPWVVETDFLTRFGIRSRCREPLVAITAPTGIGEVVFLVLSPDSKRLNMLHREAVQRVALGAKAVLTTVLGTGSDPLTHTLPAAQSHGLVGSPCEGVVPKPKGI